jgi:hypothetical protein
MDGAFTWRVNVHAPVSKFESETVPEMVYEPRANDPVEVITPVAVLTLRLAFGAVTAYENVGEPVNPVGSKVVAKVEEFCCKITTETGRTVRVVAAPAEPENAMVPVNMDRASAAIARFLAKIWREELKRRGIAVVLPMI